ncbi:hypothetical protein ACIOD2_32900 [Amycolatopsis sp. NPDC088138]|uniref:hypothetical protein n=1 Tax=Amycolatopsis sp. NPDC088138 TaxID=3363938 RepID=UPI00380D1FE2
MVLADGSLDGPGIGTFSGMAVILLAGVVGGVVVWGATKMSRRLRLLPSHRFWKTMGNRVPFIVLGAPDWAPAVSWEKSGMVGMGDIQALVEIESQLRRLGFSGTIVESKELTPQELKRDLVLIGGPDGNSVTATMMGRMNGASSYAFAMDLGPDAGAVYDKRSSREITPKYDDLGNPMNDFGLIIRAANPLAPDTAEIVILAGCWGFGTAAAAEKLGDQKFLRQLKKSRHFEVLVETTVEHGAHYNTKVRDTRTITPVPAE